MRVLLAALAVFVLTTGVAGAAGPRQIAPGVFADPSTPAGKEYALQLQQARGTGSPPPSATTHATTPLFGAGIAAKPRTPTRRTKAAKKSAAPAAPTPAPAAPVSAPAVPATPASSDGGGGGGTLALVGGAAAILVLGGLGGVLLRRRRPLGPSPERRIG